MLNSIYMNSNGALILIIDTYHINMDKIIDGVR